MEELRRTNVVPPGQQREDWGRRNRTTESPGIMPKGQRLNCPVYRVPEVKEKRWCGKFLERGV